MTLYVDNPKLWENTIDAISDKEVSAKEKLLARHLVSIVDWCGEIADDDTDFWGDRIRFYPGMCSRQTGMSKSTVWRIIKRWQECGLVSKRSENYIEASGQYHSRTYIVLSQKFYDGDIRTSRTVGKRGVKKGHKFTVCPSCGYRLYKDQCTWETEESETRQ